MATPETQTPQNITTLTQALELTEISYSYYSPEEISRTKPSFLNQGNLALKGMIHALNYDAEKGMYTATAALGNASAHDNLREVAGAKQHFGFVPPQNFAWGFGGIYTHWYPRIDKTHVNVQFDRPLDNASATTIHESSVIADAIALRLEFITGGLGRSIQLGIHDPALPLRDILSGGEFVPRLPSKRDVKSIFSMPH